MKAYMKPAPPVIMMFLIPSRGSNLVVPIRYLEGLWIRGARATALGVTQVEAVSISVQAAGGDIVDV